MRFVGPRSAHVKYDVTDCCVWYAIDRLLKPHSRDHVAAVSTLLNTFFSSSNLAVFFSLRNPFYTQEHGSWDVSFPLEHHGLKQFWPWDDLGTLTVNPTIVSSREWRYSRFLCRRHCCDKITLY